MDELSTSSPTTHVVFMKAAQIGASEAGNNWLGYVVDIAPGPTLAVLPTVETAKRTSRQRIDPLIEESPSLRSKVKSARSRDSGNTVLSKEFPGGLLILTGANSAVGLRSMPARNLFLDEVDAYPHDVDEEGDPVALAERRTNTFARKKVLKVSTPTIAGRSRIEKDYQASDQRRYFCPCPECGEYQTLEFKQLRWDKGDPRSVTYVCSENGCVLGEADKTEMLARGEWRATAPGDDKAAGFHLNGLYSPVGWLSWAEIVKQWEEAQADPELLKQFVNTVLGETWQERGDAPEWKRLYDRREDYPIGRVPRGGLFLTAGVDVQKNRLEVEIVGWGRNKQSWSVDYRVLPGDPSAPEVWADLTSLLAETFPHEDGVDLPIRLAAVDSGYATQEVYSWARLHPPSRVMVVKGQEAALLAVGVPKEVDAVTSAGKKLRRGVRVWPVGVSMLKSELYGWLRQERPTEESGEKFPLGYCHFPKYGEEYFQQLTAEQVVTRVVRGYPKRSWEKTRDRNEALDCRIYARAAASRLRYERMRDHEFAELETALGVPAVADVLPSTAGTPAAEGGGSGAEAGLAPSSPLPSPPPAPAPAPAPSRRPGYFGRNPNFWRR